MARPLRSVSSVRVSLTVTTKHRTEPGAAALCSASLAGVIGRIVACVLPSAHAPQPRPRSHEITKKMCFFFVCFFVSLCLGGLVSRRCAARSIRTRPGRRAVGGGDQEEADAGRKNRSAD